MKKGRHSIHLKYKMQENPIVITTKISLLSLFLLSQKVVMHKRNLNKHVFNRPDINCLTPRKINDGLAIQIHMIRRNERDIKTLKLTSLIRTEKHQQLKTKYYRQIKHKMCVWVLTRPVSDLGTENYQNGDLDPVRGQEYQAGRRNETDTALWRGVPTGWLCKVDVNCRYPLRSKYIQSI